MNINSKTNVVLLKQGVRIKKFNTHYMMYICDENRIEAYKHIFEIDRITYRYIVYLLNMSLTHDEAIRKIGSDFNININDIDDPLYSFMELLHESDIIYVSNDGSHSYKMLFLPGEIYGITVDITNNCNLKCTFCLRDSSSTGSLRLDESELVKIAGDVNQIKPFIVNISGGEPLLYIEELLKFITLISMNVQYITIYTNGTLLSESTLNRLIEAGVTSFRISIDSSDEKIHNSLRGHEQAFQKAINAIKLLQRYKVYTDVLTVINKKNIDDIENIREFLKDKTDSITFIPIAPLGRGENHDLLLDDKEMVTFYRTISSDDTSIDFKPNPDNYCSCSHSYSSPLIDFKGNVYPCVQMLFPEFCMGNINSASLADLWRNDEILNRCFPEIDSLPGCGKCKFKRICNGGCRAIVYELTKNIQDRSIYTCNSTKKFVQYLLENGNDSTIDYIKNTMES